MDISKTGQKCVDRIYLAWDRDRWRAFVSTIVKLQVP
jgi:hypothetical protein